MGCSDFSPIVLGGASAVGNMGRFCAASKWEEACLRGSPGNLSMYLQRAACDKIDNTTLRDDCRSCCLEASASLVGPIFQ